MGMRRILSRKYGGCEYRKEAPVFPRFIIERSKESANPQPGDRPESGNFYYLLWFYDGVYTIGSFVPSKLIFEAQVAARIERAWNILIGPLHTGSRSTSRGVWAG
jgi:hypothetical protein